MYYTQKYNVIIYFRWIFNFGYFVGLVSHEFKIQTKFYFIKYNCVLFDNPRIQMSTIVKPRNSYPRNKIISQKVDVQIVFTYVLYNPGNAVGILCLPQMYNYLTCNGI